MVVVMGFDWGSDHKTAVCRTACNIPAFDVFRPIATRRELPGARRASRPRWTRTRTDLASRVLHSDPDHTAVPRFMRSAHHSRLVSRSSREAPARTRGRGPPPRNRRWWRRGRDAVAGRCRRRGRPPRSRRWWSNAGSGVCPRGCRARETGQPPSLLTPVRKVKRMWASLSLTTALRVPC